MKMLHCTIQTACLEESIEFWKENVGLKVVNDLRGIMEKDIVFLANEEGDTCIELIRNEEAPFQGSGISIGFSVDDVEKAREECVAKGLNPTPMVHLKPNAKFFYFEDPNGFRIQFV